MSVILEALQKARRERAEKSVMESHESLEGGAEEAYQIVYRPVTRAPKARGARWWLVVLISFSSFLLLVMVAALLYLVLLRMRHTESNPGDWLLGKPAAATAAVSAGTANLPAASPAVSSPASAMPAAELPVVGPTPMTAVTARQTVPAPPQQAGQFLPVSTPAAGGAEYAAPPSLSNQLPTPVPLQELEREQTVTGDTALVPAAKVPASVDGLTLGTILYDAVSPMATINGRLVHQGKTYGDLTIVRITQNEVLIRRKDGTQFTLTHGL